MKSLTDDLRLKAIRDTMDAAVRAHERAFTEAVRRFDELSPLEQQLEQLRKWQALIAEDRR